MTDKTDDEKYDPTQESTGQVDQSEDPGGETPHQGVQVDHPDEVSNLDSRVAGDEGDDGDTFPRSYVEQLRQENGKYRQRAQRADELANRLHRALVEQTGRLVDPSDLPFNEAHLDDPETLVAALDELLATKPHLASRKVVGDVGQGATGTAAEVNLLGILRGEG